MKELKVFRAEANMIPLSSVSKDFVQDVTDKYTFILYQEKTCAKCPLLEQRHSEPCDACEAYLGTRQLSKIVTKGANQYLSVPLGGTKRLENLLEAHEYKPSYVSKHADGAPFVRPLLFVREAREWQTEALAVCLERKRGIVESPPRSGKTILGVLLAAAVGKKTLIIASQREWLSQFMYSFVGKEDEPAFTNLNPKRIGFCKTVEDFDSKEICLATFQQFMNPSGRLILQEIHKKFSLVLVDEVHITAALETSRVLAKFNAEYLIGLSGTPQRKNTSEEIFFKLLVGPILYVSKVEMLRPVIELLKTNVTIDVNKNDRSRAAFTRFVGKLEIEKTRVKIIVARAVKAVKEGHSVMIPVARAKSVDVYVKALNEHFPEAWAVPFTGQLHAKVRAKNLADIKSGVAKVVVGNIALLSTGLNIPRLSMLIDRVTITSNLPKAVQRIARILTPFEGKIQPRLVIVQDDSNMQRNTAKNEYTNAIKPRFNPRMTKSTHDELMAWFKKKDVKTIDLSEI